MNTLVVWLLALGVGVSSLVASRSLMHYFQLESYQFAGYFRTLKRNFLRAMTPGTIMTVYLLLLLLIHRSIDRRFHDGSVFCIFVAIVTLALAVLGLRCGVTLPCFFLLAVPAWSACAALTSFSAGKGRRVYDRRWLLRLVLVMLVLLAGACVELWFLPRFVLRPALQRALF